MTNASRMLTAGLALALALGAGTAARAADAMPEVATGPPMTSEAAMAPEAAMNPEAATAPEAAPAPANQALRPEVAEGIRRLNARDYADAVRSLTAAVGSDPTDAAARYYLGYAYYRMGDFSQARAAFAGAYRADPHYSPARAGH
jgi:Flp pilus assembly protein TadD